MLYSGALTVNAAIPVMVRLEVDLGAESGRVLHSMDGLEWKEFNAADAVNDLSAAVVFALCPDGGVRIRVLSQASVGSGLGGSSAYGVALARAVMNLVGREMTDTNLVALVRDLEARVLKVPTGIQDHWPGITGGVLAIHHEPGGERVEELDLDPEWIGDRITIFDTGISHHSGMVNWQVIRRLFEQDPVTTQAFAAIAEAAAECRKALVESDEADVGRSISEEWGQRKRLAPEVCPSEVELIERAALRSGALAVKACGAGGGGSLLLWHPPELRHEVCAAMEAQAPNGRVVATGISKGGCRVRS
jgi:D-glycero-alpha-D-manno-heptose-7-phosphate kinase